RDLSGANLSGANLSGANLSGTNLSDADFSGADFTGAYLGDRTIREMKWDENTKWENIRGLDTAVDVPEALRRQVGMQ
ncbi:MAG TPA: pentapeptide repeat-containing protein, partial [Phormidium sp.]